MELRHYAGKYIHLLLTDHLRVQLDSEGLAEAVRGTHCFDIVDTVPPRARPKSPLSCIPDVQHIRLFEYFIVFISTVYSDIQGELRLCFILIYMSRRCEENHVVKAR